jgi:hypothetical protein
MSREKFWAVSSLIAGLIWVALALLPIPFTTALGLPFAGYAVIVGWLSRRRSQPASNRAALWGLGLGCGGLVYAIVINLILGGLLVAGLIGLVRPLLQGTPTP